MSPEFPRKNRMMMARQQNVEENLHQTLHQKYLAILWKRLQPMEAFNHHQIRLSHGAPKTLKALIIFLIVQIENRLY